MKAKLVKEAFKDIFKPLPQDQIETQFQEILGEHLGEWVMNLPYNYKITDYDDEWIEIAIRSPQNEPYYFFIRGSDETIKTMPPETSVFSKAYKLETKEDLHNYINHWLTGKLKDDEETLRAISNYNFPDED
jgi:hypothetical protein